MEYFTKKVINYEKDPPKQQESVKNPYLLYQQLNNS